MANKDEFWDSFGVEDAYYAVATFDKYRGSNLNEDAKAEFFESGQQHIADVFDTIETEFRVRVNPKRALDYGCGVGRILLPLAKKCDSVTGVDIAQNMLAETRRNFASESIENFRLIKPLDFLECDAATYDFVHSYIVFQHISPKIGYEIIRTMAERLEMGGSGMVHVTHTNTASAFGRLRSKIYRDFPVVHRFLNRLRGRTESPMPMHEYNRDKVFDILRENGCGETFVRPTDHGFLGEMIFFRKAEKDRVHMIPLTK